MAKKAKAGTKKASVAKALVKAVKAAAVPPKKARAKKYVYFFGSGKADGDRTMKDTLGGKEWDPKKPTEMQEALIKWLKTQPYTKPSKINDPELAPIWAAAARLNIPIIIHTAEPQEFFHQPDMHNERWLELKMRPSNRSHSPVRPSVKRIFSVASSSARPGSTSRITNFW